MNKTVSKKYKIKSNSLYIKQVILNLLSQHLFYRVQRYTLVSNRTKKTLISGKKTGITWLRFLSCFIGLRADK